MEDIWGAASRGDLDEVERLVGHEPALVDAQDLDGTTPLMQASMEGHVEVVRCLLDKGAAVNRQDDDGRTALWHAASEGRPPVVALLLERGADPSIADSGGLMSLTPLMIASIHHLEVVRFFLGHPSGKATINQRDRVGRTGGGPATTAVGGWRRPCWTVGPTPRSPTSSATPPWPSPSRILLVRLSPPRAAGSAWRRWR
jgi:ankyrin repeat protein